MLTLFMLPPIPPDGGGRGREVGMGTYVVVVRRRGQAVPVAVGDWAACVGLARTTQGASVRPATPALCKQLASMRARVPQGPVTEVPVGCAHWED